MKTYWVTYSYKGITAVTTPSQDDAIEKLLEKKDDDDCLSIHIDDVEEAYEED